MTGRPRSVRQAQAQHAALLRHQGCSWAEIGTAFQLAYRVNPRVAMRQVHGWSQPQAAARWTQRWPDDPKTFKNFSYWEQWPGQTGHAPSLDTLDRLAQLYECKLTDLLADCRDYGAGPVTAGAGGRNREPEPEQPEPVGEPIGEAVLEPDLAGLGGLAGHQLPALRAALEMIKEAGRADAGGAEGAGDPPHFRLRRRTLLLEASSALAVMAAAPRFEVPSIIAGTRSRLSADPIIEYAGEVVAGLRRLGGAVGPRITVPPAMALRSAMAAFARHVPEIVTSKALTAYGDLTQLVGWLMFNLGDHKAAGYYYDDARDAAYRAGNDDLASYALAALGQLAIARRQPPLAIDHARAASRAGRASGNPYAVAYAADVTARAYAASGQVGRCQAALDREQEALARITADTPRSPWWYFYDRSFYWGTESECALRLGMPVDAADAADRSLRLLGPTNLHNSALTLSFRAEALIRQGEYAQACDTLADSARLTTLNSSRRIARRIESLRRQLRVAEDTAEVRELDEKLAGYRRARAAAEPAKARIGP